MKTPATSLKSPTMTARGRISALFGLVECQELHAEWPNEYQVALR